MAYRGLFFVVSTIILTASFARASTTICENKAEGVLFKLQAPYVQVVDRETIINTAQTFVSLKWDGVADFTKVNRRGTDISTVSASGVGILHVSNNDYGKKEYADYSLINLNKSDEYLPRYDKSVSQVQFKVLLLKHEFDFSTDTKTMAGATKIVKGPVTLDCTKSRDVGDLD